MILGIALTSALVGKNAFALDLDLDLNLDNEFSFGMALPNPAGVSVKYWTSDTHALAAFSSWSTKNSKYLFQLDYLTHDFSAIPIEPGAAPFYYGLGVRVQTQKGRSSETSLRIPVGISYLMDTAPLDLFAELGPRIRITPSTKFKLNIAFGIRYRIMP